MHVRECGDGTSYVRFSTAATHLDVHMYHAIIDLFVCRFHTAVSQADGVDRVEAFCPPSPHRGEISQANKPELAAPTRDIGSTKAYTWSERES